MGTPRSTTPLCSIVMVAGMLIMVMPYALDRAYSADPPQGQPKSSQSEPSPEEAAGGAHNLQLMRKACDEDVKKLCPDIRPGGGRILQCLRGQESNLSPSCRQVLAARSSKP